MAMDLYSPWIERVVFLWHYSRVDLGCSFIVDLGIGLCASVGFVV